ncbi:MAG: hypothetical protein Greene041614_519 [Parcubacteria group bacterium Greene0416_14]|nr:MAG: hypothetical protein Greene041614_519 [Parcubacteria group bacterium Greene0416_14]TSD01660.1 MAG: hypothetical protein Greene101415_58 [Parcubacteria group bacterium Greene1014_15]
MNTTLVVLGNERFLLRRSVDCDPREDADAYAPAFAIDATRDV